MNVHSNNYMRNFVGFLTIAMVLLSPQHPFAYEHEIKILSTSMADHIAKAGKKRIAVVDFTDLQGNITELGRFLAEELSVDLTNTAKGFEVIDRNHLNRILAEHKLSLSGIVDQKTVQKLGQIAGVDALITGSITPLERSVRVVCKVIATDTARVISAAKGDIPKTKAIEELFGKGIETGTSGQTTTSSKPQTKVQQSDEVKDFVFELQECKTSGQDITCSFLITNKKEDGKRGRELALYIYWGGSSRMFDDQGNEYKARSGQLGNKEGTPGISGLDNVFPYGVPTKASLTFENVRKGIKMITLLEINVSIEDRYSAEWAVQFRNIPLSR